MEIVGIGACIVIVIGSSLRYNWWRLPISTRHPRVLMYHSINYPVQGQRKRNKWRVNPEDFEKQMMWLQKNGWTSYTVSELVRMEHIGVKSFVLTFDDGFEDNFINAFPILKKYGFKATVYLTTERAQNDWENFSDEKYDLLLKPEQIREMAASGLIEFGSHTKNHVNLLRCGYEKAKEEIYESKGSVERLSGERCEAFAYPYGKYDETIKKLVQEAGYSNATAVKRGVHKLGNDLMEIKRIGILGTESFFDFYLKMTRVRNKL